MATNSSSNIITAAAGKVLQGAGIGTANAFSTATYPSTATGTGKILRADGTNWAATTATYPDTAGTSGKVLISDGTNIVSSTPTYPNAASTSLKHIKSDGTNFVTTTVTYPDASVTAGKVMVSDGTNYIASTPTFPNASATTRKIIVSDGTNWTASTETYAVPGTSGNRLVSDGTNWTSSVGLITVTGTLTNAQIKALHATPVQIVAAPGAGNVLIPVHMTMTMNYGGTNAFTNGAGADITLYYSTTVINVACMTASNITATATRIQAQPGTTLIVTVLSTVANLALNLYNPSVTEIAGNAANNNTMSYRLTYYVMIP